MGGGENGDESGLSPAQAFTAIGNETRVKILQELWEAPERPVSFSELRERVGMKDSAQFSYHLRKLSDHFIRKTEGGYTLRWAGLRIVWAIRAGVVTNRLYIEPFESGGSCVECGAQLLARYDDEFLTIECPGCNLSPEFGTLPPAALVGRTNDELLDVLMRQTRCSYELNLAGICFSCRGTTKTKPVRDPTDTPRWIDPDLDPSNPYEPGFRIECEQCGAWSEIPVSTPLLFHPDVIRFYADHGIDLNTTHHWELDWWASGRRTSVVSTDPPVYAVTIELGDDRLRATIDDELNVVETETGSSVPENV